MPSNTGARRVSIRDVANACGVSLATVSLVLNHGDHRISQATRQRVLAKVSELGYRPNRLAQGLQTRRSNILAILVPQLRQSFADAGTGELVGGIYDQAARSGYKILLEAAGPAFIRQKKYLELFDRCYADGVLFLGAGEEHTFVRELARANYPLLLVNGLADDADYVVCDYAAAGRMAADHLVELGHQRIGMIHSAAGTRAARELQEAFVQTIAQRDIELTEGHLEPGTDTEEAGAGAARRLLARLPDLTAVFAGSDRMAVGALSCLAALGHRVPDDVSVIGCDDIPQAAAATPPLTTIRTPLYELGKRCCAEMIRRLSGQSGSCRLLVPVELVVRGTTAAPRV